MPSSTPPLLDPRLLHEYRRQTPGYSEYASETREDIAPTLVHLLELLGIPGLSDAASLAIGAKEGSGLGMGMGLLGALPFVPNITKPAREAWSQLIPIKGFIPESMGAQFRNKKKTRVWKNPSHDELKRLGYSDPKETYRSFVSEDGDLYVWNAYDAIHDQITDALKVRPGAFREASDISEKGFDIYDYWKYVKETEEAYKEYPGDLWFLENYK